MNDVSRKQSSILLLASIVCMAIALLLRADIALQQATRPHRTRTPCCGSASPATTSAPMRGRPGLSIVARDVPPPSAIVCHQ